MKIQVLNLEAIERAVRQRLAPAEGAFEKAVETEKEGIRIRTQQGIDVNGEQFKPYSPRNPGRNWKAIRERTNFQTAYVDLTYTKDMFRALKASFKKDGNKFLATIFFDERKQAQKAKGHHTGQLGSVKFEPRKFFGLSKFQRETIVSKIRNAK